MKQKVIIKNVRAFYDGKRNFIVVPVSKEVRKDLSEFCEIPDTEELLFAVSAFASIDAVDELDRDAFANGVGSAEVSVKLETAEYDWNYKSKKGHTKKWQVCGILFKSPLVDNNLEGLEDD